MYIRKNSNLEKLSHRIDSQITFKYKINIVLLTNIKMLDLVLLKLLDRDPNLHQLQGILKITITKG